MSVKDELLKEGRKRAVALLAGGATFAAVCTATGYGLKTVRKWARESGIVRGPGGRAEVAK